MRLIVFIVLCLSLTGCNSVYMKPGTMDTSKVFYAPRGGYSMQRSIKQTMEERGYTVNVGTIKTEKTVDVPAKARYAVSVKERKEFLRPIWCIFNGFWWWNFNASITDRTTGEEILTWRGRGCANSSLRKLNDILDELEMKKPEKNTIKKKKRDRE